MKIRVRTTGTISAALAAKIRKAADGRKIMGALAEATVQMTKNAFHNPALRPEPWAAKADGTPATLIKDGPLKRSPHVLKVGAKSALVGSDRRYAAAHQFGTKPYQIRAKKGKALKIPLRGYIGMGGIRSGGGTIFRRVVKHPGQKARPFFPWHRDGRPTAKLVRNLETVGRKLVGF